MGINVENSMLQQTVECMGKAVCVNFDRYYMREHLWVKVTPEGNLKIGLTDYAQQFLKKKIALIEFMKNHTVGDDVDEGEIFCTVYGGLYADPETLQYECMAFDMFSPVKGTVLEVNQAIMDKPQLVNANCYDEGWITVIQPEKGWNLVSNLIEPAKYVKLLKTKGRSPLRVL